MKTLFECQDKFETLLAAYCDSVDSKHSSFDRETVIDEARQALATIRYIRRNEHRPLERLVKAAEGMLEYAIEHRNDSNVTAFVLTVDELEASAKQARQYMMTGVISDQPTDVTNQ